MEARVEKIVFPAKMISKISKCRGDFTKTWIGWRSVFCLILVFALNSPLCILKGQNHVIDSLLRVLPSQKDDTNRANTLNFLSLKLRQIYKYDTAITFANQALLIDSLIGYEKGMAAAYYNIGACFYYKGKYEVSIIYSEKCLSIYRKENDKRRVVNSLNQLGNNYNNLGDYSKALECFYTMLDSLKNLDYEVAKAGALGNIGNIYQDQHEFSKALEFQFNALGLNEELKNDLNKMNNLGSIGLIYNALGKYDSALKYHHLELDLARHYGIRDKEAVSLTNIGEVYTNKLMYDSALRYDREALKIDRESSKRLLAYDLDYIGHIYSMQKRYALSKIFLDSALLISKQIGEKECTKDVYNDIAILDSLKGDTKALQLAYS